MKGEWRHAICNPCWYETKSDGREAHRLVKPSGELCCYCGQLTSSGIYVREDPKSEALKCNQETLFELKP